MLDADAIARELNPLNPSAASIAAGRETLRRTVEYLNLDLSFAVETTLSSLSTVDLIRRARSRGYETRLLFICLENPDQSIARIRNRVARGGHFVSEADVRRRYARSLANSAQALRSADYAEFYDNSGEGHRLILIAKAGVL